MVWGLFPVDPLPGEDKYYIFSSGTYKVGRKGCDVIINKDKGVSRIHAEILVDEMICLDHQQKSSSISSKVQIRDSSKYGTYINKITGLKEKVHEFPNKETSLKDGDLVSFGTGNATYKFCYIPLTFLVHSKKPLDQYLQDKISSIGASVTREWNSRCTHVIVEDLIPLKEDLLDAILARKPLARPNWVELIAGKSICTEFPSCISYAPTLTMEGASIKIGDLQSREHCLRGYTFLLESTYKYKFKDRFQALLEVGGAKVVSVEAFCPYSQGVEEEGNNCVVRVIPNKFTNRSGGSRNVSSLPSVTEAELISAVLSGHLNTSVISSPPVLVTSSCSTDETVVADSDTEIESATSPHTHATVDPIESAEDDCKMIVDTHLVGASGKNIRGESDILIVSTESESKQDLSIHKVESTEYNRKVEVQTNAAAVNRSEGGHITVSRERDESKAEKTLKTEEYDTGNVDIIYSQDLIVRDINFPASVHTSTESSVINFKCFRKRGAPSGNSFNNLIPFSKYPYKESDNGNEEVAESMKEEKKRKQMESIAEDLFNNEKARRRGTAGRGATGSLSELLARS